MSDNNNLYDRVISEGVYWLFRLKENHNLCIEDCELNTDFKFFLQLTHIYSVYASTIYIKCPLWKYIYIKYFQKNHYLKLFKKQNKKYEDISMCYINVDRFLKELAECFEQPVTIFTDIYNQYYRR